MHPACNPMRSACNPMRSACNPITYQGAELLLPRSLSAFERMLGHRLAAELHLGHASVREADPIPSLALALALALALCPSLA
jgi:hypothetical protein